MKPVKDKRASERVEVDGELLLDIHNDSFINASTVNISASGINFSSSAAIPLFREVEIQITLPGITKGHNIREIKCHAVVVRCAKKDAKWHDVSLFFIDLPKDARAEIEEYVCRKATVKKLHK
jgi:c-di-GMP-binding flagellar brake protein YcgR